MTTLITAPVAPLLDRLFTETDAAHPMADPAFAAISSEERLRLMRSKTDYRRFYAELKDYGLPVSRDTGRLLYMLARSTGARSIAEFGTSFGLSTLHLAAALRDNGGGRLITTELEPSKAARARENLAAGGLADLVEIREGDALDTLASDLPDTIDLLLLDSAKSLYMDVLRLVQSRLRPGAVIIADNADHCPEYLEHVTNPDNRYFSMAFTDEVELTIRLA
ncbi:O-methyltransferase [Sphingomonas sp. S2-65]|uniref:O-methyltransferase n=1 Tax=Sphingomonas sp. S2-65 TaxID=2903960 RepID=UPI001F278CD9|nr:O-methyltransferase [Sphingomonas sp. S2-65]UYY57233.1 O-methyltransferase [Sphingomonas sp. S2-65]